MGTASGEVACKRRVLGQTLALLGVPRLRSEHGGLACSHLGAEEHRLELHVKARERQTGGACLRLTASREPSLGVGARSVRLCLRVT
jgi:hypothetical protein